jgi:hypothetical protein
MAKAKQPRGRAPKGRSDLDKLAMSDSDNELEIDDGLLKVHDGTTAADRCVLSAAAAAAVFFLGHGQPAACCRCM